MKAWISTAVLGALLAALPGTALADRCTLLAVDKADSASLKVYFTKFVKEDTSNGKYKTCRIVKKADNDTQTFFITPFRQDATLVVHKSNWPG